MKTKLLFGMAVLLIGAATVSAQKQEVGLLLGGIKTSDRDIQSPQSGSVRNSSGLTYYANYAYRLAGGKNAAFYLELPFAATPSRDVQSTNVNVPRNYASLFFTPGLKVKFFPAARLSPYGAIGGGYGRIDESEFRINDQANTGRRGKNSGVFDFGGGVDIKIVKFLSLRGEVRDFYSVTPNYNVPLSGSRQHNVLTSGGFVLHF